MPIKKDLSDLQVSSRTDGHPPVAQPLVVPVLAQRWFEKYSSENNLSLGKAIPERWFRASWAAKRCDRSLHYALTDTPASEPLTLADYWRFGLGTMVHEYLQETFVSLFPGTEVEVPVDLKSIGLNGSATVDMVLQSDTGRTVVEIKTINGFGFKKAATAFKGPAEGPRTSAVIQGSLAAAALDANLIVAYLSLENLSPSMALSYGDGTTVGQFAAEWHFDAETCVGVAATEVARINRVMELSSMGVLPARELHDPEVQSGAVVADPVKGSWLVRDGDVVVGTGRTWMCDYCDHRSTCVSDGEGGVSDEVI